jgi:hypothetical protein
VWLFAVSKAQQLLQGLQSKDEGQQVTAVMEMCQVYLDVIVVNCLKIFI